MVYLFYLLTLVYGSYSLQFIKHLKSVTSSNQTTGISKNMMPNILSQLKLFVSEDEIADPVELRKIVSLLKDLKETSETREKKLIDTLDAKTKEAAIIGNAFADAQKAVESAKSFLVEKEAELATVKTDFVAKLEEKNIAKKEHDEEIDALNDEQQLLADVIKMLQALYETDLDSTYAPTAAPTHTPTAAPTHTPTEAWVLHSIGKACEANDDGRDSSCDGDLDCCKSSIIAKGLQYVVWYQDTCWGSPTCDTPYQLPESVTFRYINDENIYKDIDARMLYLKCVKFFKSFNSFFWKPFNCRQLQSKWS